MWMKQGDPNTPKACICQMTYVNGGPYAHSVTGPVCPTTGRKSVVILFTLNWRESQFVKIIINIVLFILNSSMKHNEFKNVEP